MKTDTQSVESVNGVVNTSTLAAHLGLSRWTVSRVLNDHPGVKAETRDRVMSAVSELGFEPNLQARSLRGLPTKLVGVSFQQFETPILAQKSAEMQKQLVSEGYRGLFELPGWNPSLEAEVVKHFLSMGVDGIVLIGSTLSADDEIFRTASDRGVAMVAVDPRNNLVIPQVELDRSLAMEMNIDHLVELGHRRFALLGLRSDDMYLSRRTRGLKKAIAKHGLDWDRDVLEIWEDNRDIQSRDYGMRLGQLLLEQTGDLPTGIIALNDRIALGALRAFGQANKRVPEDFSMIGFDNLDESAWWNPSLTSIDQSVDKLMKAATEVLLKTMNGERVPQLTKIEPRLIVRESTAQITI